MRLFTYESKTIAGDKKYIAAIPGDAASSISANYRGNLVNANPMPKSNSSKFINVCDDFDWTTTPVQNSGFKKEFITRGQINEYRIADDSVINSILYNVEAIAGGAKAEAAAISQGLKRLSDDLVDLQKLGGGAVGATYDNILNKVASLVRKTFTDPKTAGTAALGEESFQEDWMKPYQGLYSLQKTGFTYILPYFENTRASLTNNIVAINFPTFIGDAVDASYKAAETVANLNKLIAPGQYVERPMVYDPAQGSKPSVTFKFPLLNTLSYEGAVKNYQLLWLLIYQSTPYRVTKSLVELPKMYEVNVPGVEYMPFSYTSSLAINFVGNRRHVDVPIPTLGGSSSMKAIMPDAFDVSITFQSMTMRASNMMLQMANKSTKLPQ